MIAAAPADGSEGRLIALGAEFLAIPVEAASRSPIDDLRLLKAILSIARRIRPSFILTFTIKPNIYGSIAARLLGIPAIATISGLGSAFISGGAMQAIVSKMFRFALGKTRTVFFQNSDDRAFFVDRKIVDGGKTVIVPGSGIDLSHFVPADLPESGPFTFLMIGRLLRDKGVEEYAAAAQLVRERGFAARFRILGEVGVANPSAVTSEQVVRWVADETIEHIEPVADVRPMISEAHAIVLPSYREGLPRSLLEGAAMARPLIATDVPGCRDLVRDERNGYLCAARSSVSLADALIRLITTGEGERQKMGDESRKLVEENYDQRLVSDAYLKAIAP